MKKYIFLGIALVAMFVLLFTNPSKQEHSDAVKELLNKNLNDKLSEDMAKPGNGMESFGAGLGMLLGKTMIDKMVDSSITRENYLLFSLTKATVKKEEKTIGYGVLGSVHIFDAVKEKTSDLFKDKNEEK